MAGFQNHVAPVGGQTFQNELKIALPSDEHGSGRHDAAAALAATLRNRSKVGGDETGGSWHSLSVPFRAAGTLIRPAGQRC
jgi:hypothetical protein